MSNILSINNHKAAIRYDGELGLFRGEFIGLNGGADFYADNIADLQREGEKSLHAFLEVCAEQGINPYNNYSGRFVARLPSELHKAAAELANERGISLNQLVNDALARLVSVA